MGRQTHLHRLRGSLYGINLGSQLADTLYKTQERNTGFSNVRRNVHTKTLPEERNSALQVRLVSQNAAVLRSAMSSRPQRFLTNHSTQDIDAGTRFGVYLLNQGCVVIYSGQCLPTALCVTTVHCTATCSRLAVYTKKDIFRAVYVRTVQKDGLTFLPFLSLPCSLTYRSVKDT